MRASLAVHISRTSRGRLVPLRRLPHVDERQDPGHEELREREEVGDVDLAHDFLLHQLREPAHQHRQREVVDDEKDGCRDEKPRLSFQQGLERRPGGDAIPVGRVRGWRVVRRHGAEARESPRGTQEGKRGCPQATIGSRASLSAAAARVSGPSGSRRASSPARPRTPARRPRRESSAMAAASRACSPSRAFARRCPPATSGSARRCANCP